MIGLGIKGAYIFQALQTYYGLRFQPANTQRNWELQNNSDHFRRFNFNLAPIFKYYVKRFSFGCEAWLGISNLNALPLIIRVRENNLRFTIVAHELVALKAKSLQSVLSITAKLLENIGGPVQLNNGVVKSPKPSPSRSA